MNTQEKIKATIQEIAEIYKANYQLLILIAALSAVVTLFKNVFSYYLNNSSTFNLAITFAANLLFYYLIIRIEIILLAVCYRLCRSEDFSMPNIIGFSNYKFFPFFMTNLKLGLIIALLLLPVLLLYLADTSMLLVIVLGFAFGSVSLYLLFYYQLVGLIALFDKNSVKIFNRSKS